MLRSISLPAVSMVVLVSLCADGMVAAEPMTAEPVTAKPVTAQPVTAEPVTALPLAGPQRGRSGGKPRTRKPRARKPRGIGPNKALDAILAEDNVRTGGAAPDSGRGVGRTGALGAAPGSLLGAEDGSGAGHPPERQQRLWFAQADMDSSGWISFREAGASLGFDAPNYRAIDSDRDGRLAYPEFHRYVLSESNKNRRFRAPITTSLESEARRRTPQQLRAAFDSDLDQKISRFEFETMLRDYSQEALRLDQQDIFVRLDADGDGKLDVNELERIASFLTPLGPGSPVGQPVVPGANTVLELFGATQDMGDAHPPRIVGPVPPFRRLDLNNDGFVDLEDLERLEGRSFNPVRLRSVLNTLDINDDDRLSEGEFLASMTPPRR